MAPVEQTTMPRCPERRGSISDLKVVERAKEIPVVSDTLSVVSGTLQEIEKVTNKLSEYSTVKSAKEMVEHGIKSLTDNPRLQGGIKVINENSTFQQTVSSVKDSVYPTVVNAVDKLDTMACGGIDSLTNALPALNTPTNKIVQSTKDTAHSYFSNASEYLASFAVSRFSLKAADYSLGMAEKIVEKDMKALGRTDSKIRRVRRTIRALCRAGERRSRKGLDDLSRAGFVGRFCSIVHVNTLLHKFGLELEAERTKPDDCDAPTSRDDSAIELTNMKGDDEDDTDSEDSIDGTNSTENHQEVSESEPSENCCETKAEEHGHASEHHTNEISTY